MKAVKNTEIVTQLEKTYKASELTFKVCENLNIYSFGY